MRSLVIHRPFQASVEEVATPRMEAGWALLRPILTGICGSDLHAYSGHQPFVRYPVIPGHETVATVVEIGEPDIAGSLPPNRWSPGGLRPGLRVTLDPAVPCGRCYSCRMGRYNACAKQQVIGVHKPGAMADFVLARTDCLCIVPDHVPDSVAALTEPLSIGRQACERGRIGAGDWVGILGAGMVGLSVLLQARARGARCAVVEPVEWRRILARDLGAEITVTPEAVADGLGDWGEDGHPTVVVEAAGRPETLALAINLVSSCGRVVVLGFWPDEIRVPGPVVVGKEVNVVGSRLHCGTIQKTVAQLAAGALDLGPLEPAIVPLVEGPEAFEALSRGELEVSKVLLRA